MKRTILKLLRGDARSILEEANEAVGKEASGDMPNSDLEAAIYSLQVEAEGMAKRAESWLDGRQDIAQSKRG